MILSVFQKEGSILIAVEDSGLGIDDEKLNKIVEHKYRANNLKKDGYGIGLSLVQHVTNLCGGMTYVESIPNVRTKFYMVFKALTLD